MRGKAIVFSDFAGGLNTEASPYDLPAGQARAAYDVVPTASRGIRKRDGSILFTATPAEFTSLFASGPVYISVAQAEANGDGVTDPRYIIGSSGANVYASRTDGSGTSPITTGHVVGSRWEVIRAPAIGGQGPFYMVNGTVGRQWSGISVETAAADWTATVVDATHIQVPRGKYMIYHGNRVWMTGVDNDRSAVYFSNVGDPRDWPTANVVRFDPADGEDITGIGTAGQYVLVFKKSKVWLITNLDNGANRLLARNVGTMSHRSIVETPRGTFFLTADQGVMVANQNNTQLLSNNDQVSPQILTQLSTFAGWRNQAAAAFFNNHYYLSIPSGAGALTFDYDMTFNSWWAHRIAAHQFAVRPTSDGEPQMYGAMQGIAQVRRLFVPNTPTDLGVAFNSFWSSAFHTIGDPAIRKRCREARIVGKGSAEVWLDKDTTVADFDYTTGITGDRRLNDARLHSPGVGYAWSVTVGNTASSTFELESYTLAMQGRTD